jgi:hypothetical protein
VRERKAGQAVIRFATSAVLLGIFAPSEVAAQQASTSQQSAASSTPAENNGEDFTRPQTLFQLRYLYQTAPGSGSEPGTTHTVTTDALILRSDLKIDVAPQWTMALRGDLPLNAKNPITSNNPDGDYLYGLGDADVQAALIKTIDTRWAAGAGLRLIMPTGTGDLTSGVWQTMPIVGARVMLPEITDGSFFTGLARYNLSVAGNPGAKYISNLQLDPLLNINLPDRWFVTFYPSPDIRINFGDPVAGQTGRLFLPFDFLVGRNLTKTMTVSLELSAPVVNQYPVYNFKTVTRFNINF